MGQAKKKQAAMAANYEALEVEIKKVSHAIIRLFNATSLNQGVDCFTVANVAQQLLADQGIATELVAGFASWRVGPGDTDIVGHTNSGQQHIPGGLQGFPYHVWLSFPSMGLLVDFTTYQLPLKAAQLDEMDGGTTVVNWAPPYLFTPGTKCLTEKAVLMAAEPVAYYYEPNAEVLKRLRDTEVETPENIEMARAVMANPNAMIFGPASF